MTGSHLHLIRPYGFFLDEKSLKRSGLDYWPKINVHEYDNFEDFQERATKAIIVKDYDEDDTGIIRKPRSFFVETDGGVNYTDVSYRPNDFLIFGSETTGLPPKILQANKDSIIRIPMIKGERSLNLSVAVGIVLYEALRQTGFDGLF